MDTVGFLEIKIIGVKGNIALTSDLLYPVDRSDRPIISYKIEDGSVKHIFKTLLQYIIGFNAVPGQKTVRLN